MHKRKLSMELLNLMKMKERCLYQSDQCANIFLTVYLLTKIPLCFKLVMGVIQSEAAQITKKTVVIIVDSI